MNNYNVASVENFGQWLRRHRKQLRLTQKDVADRANLSFSYVSTLERQQPHTITGNDILPTREKVESLARAVQGDLNEALLLCGYAPVNVQMQNGFKIHLPDGLEMYIPYSVEISTQEEADRLQQDIELVYQMTKERLRRERERVTGNGE